MTTAASLASYASSFPSFRNRIINGDMRIDQRNAGAISNPTGGTNTYTIDRWQFSFFNPGSRVTNVQQVSDDVPKGFSYSMKVSCGNNSGTQDANEQLLIQQQIEGHNVGDFSWYDNSPSVLTLSFYVKSNLTGSFPLIIKLSSNNSSQNNTGTRTLPLKYEINTANTWERKSVTFTLDAYSGTRIISNTFAIAVAFYLSAGSSRRGVAYNVWRGNANQATSGLDNYTFLDSTSNEFFITGVQLEEGTVPTPFEHRPYGVELALCQRYYYGHPSYPWARLIAPDGNPNDFNGTAAFKVTMRATPSTNELIVYEAGSLSDLSGISSLNISNQSISFIRMGSDGAADRRALDITGFVDAEL